MSTVSRMRALDTQEGVSRVCREAPTLSLSLNPSLSPHKAPLEAIQKGQMSMSHLQFIFA